MSLLFSPFEAYFDTAGRPTAAGQQLLARINSLFGGVDASVAALHGIPDGGVAGQVLAKQTATDYDADWVSLAGSGSGSFVFDDGTASAGGSFILEEGAA